MEGRESMEIKGIKQLIKLMIDNDLTELNVTDGDTKVLLKRGPGDVPVVTTIPAVAAAPAAAAAPAETPAATEAPADGFVEIKSPMVGTFYASSSPDSDSYIQVGNAVNDETVTCIVEAMKVMNEIKAECTGTIAEICVKNAQPVEFGQVLFRVKP